MRKPTYLTVDVGNTRAKLGWFQGGHLQSTEIVGNDELDEILERVTNRIPQRTIFSSTGPSVEPTVKALREEGLKAVELTSASPLPFMLDYDTPKTLGKDRLAAAAGALDLFPNTNLLIIDAGTCITMDVLTAGGLYLGGNISPGIEMRAQAMHDYTARLPRVTANLPKQRIGKGTETALQNGAVLGAILEIQGYVNWCRRRFPRLQVVLTGGNAPLLVNQLKTRIFADAFLVLRGLHKILSLYEDDEL